jgi:enamine deaminase RidA (YjgF/YER057c/UK114 family)
VSVADRLTALGIALPAVLPPAGNYLPCVTVGTTVHVGGHGPVGGPERFTGKVGAELTLEDGYRAARATGLSILATLDAELGGDGRRGGLERIVRFVKVVGMVNVAPGFTRTPEVVDGCSDLFVEVFGDAGRHTRSAVGLAELPFSIPVEIECVLTVRG